MLCLRGAPDLFVDFKVGGTVAFLTCTRKKVGTARKISPLSKTTETPLVTFFLTSISHSPMTVRKDFVEVFSRHLAFESEVWG